MLEVKDLIAFLLIRFQKCPSAHITEKCETSNLRMIFELTKESFQLFYNTMCNPTMQAVPNNLISQSKLFPFAKKSLTSNITVEILAVAVVSF